MNYSFPNFTGCIDEIWEWITKFHATLNGASDYLIHVGIEVNLC